MPRNSDRAVEIQRQYYTETTAQYENMHRHEGSGDAMTSRFVHAFMRSLDVRNILDVGTATGRGMRDFKDALPQLFICGVEPVTALIDQAVQTGNAACGAMVQATGEALPFPDASFDAVCEFGILHHVADPDAVVREMLRVAKKAVFISDSNRFGQGSPVVRLIKLALYKCKLWSAYNYLRTAGKGFRITPGDGLSYSYSVFDSFELIATWADRVILIPSLDQKGTSWFHPLLNSNGVLVCGLREWPR
jgi:ubiquinone/menaquinone biosynthesis C-methylase UbiE